MTTPVENSNTALQAEPVVEENQEPKQESKQSLLTPAPIPTNSPWKTVASSAPASLTNASPKWPSTQEAVEKLERRDRQAPAPLIKATGKEKWVPIKASIVVSSSKKPSAHANGGQPNKKQAPKKNKKTPSGNRQKKPQSHKQDKQDSSTDTASAHLEPSKHENSEEENPEEQQANGGSGTPKRASSQSHQRKPSQNNQNGFGPRRRYQNNGSNNEGGSFKPYQQYVMFQQKPNYIPFRQQQANRPYDANVNANYRQKYYQSQRQPQAPTTFYQPQSPHPFIAVNNIARQIEYYFSTENLVKDTYLRSQLTEDGYAPLSLIAKFYRIVNMSLGGDEFLIMGALREIVANAMASVDVAELEEETESSLDRYYIRSKDWEKWVAANAQENIDIPKAVAFKSSLDTDYLEQYKVDPLMFEPPHQAHGEEQNQNEYSKGNQEDYENLNESQQQAQSLPEVVTATEIAAEHAT